MTLTRPFAFNTGSNISGTTQVGDLAIGVDPTLNYYGGVGGVTWWNGPDENERYIIAVPVPAGNQPNLLEIPAYVGFYGTADLNSNSFINLVNSISGQFFNSASEAKSWLYAQEYWTNNYYIGLITAGEKHTLYAGPTFNWSWGFNNCGQLGDNTLTSRCTPISVKGGKKTFCNVDSGEYFNAALDYNGQVWSWGRNDLGQLGDNTLTSKMTPVSILGNKKTFCNINSGLHHTTVTDYLGQVWSWGYNGFGQLGDNSTTNRSTPVSILGTKKTFCNITGGFYHTVGLDLRGQVWSWGYNPYGQLGDNSTTNRSTPVSILGTKKTFCNITGGFYHTVGIDYKGRVWSWGYNNANQLGNLRNENLTPLSIIGNKKTFCKIVGELVSTLSIDYLGQVWSWGYNGYGQLGDNTVTSRLTPVSILGTKKTFCNITAGYQFAVGIDLRGQIWSWGYNGFGQLGDNSTTNRCTPVSILGNKKTFCNINAGIYHTICIDYLGQVWSWGSNNYGQLGDNSITCRCTPVSILGTKKTFCNINGGRFSTVGLDYLGQVWGWGYNNYGQLGDNTTTQRYTPVSILGTKKTFCNISVGYQHTVGLDYLGQVWSWGYNGNGQLGDNTYTSRRTPVSILGTKKTFCSINSKYYHTVGIDYLGQVWGWGDNDNGQLGDTSIINRRTPVSILGNKKTFCSISGGQKFTVGIDYLGQVWSWGNNYYDQLGVILYESTPVRVYHL